MAHSPSPPGVAVAILNWNGLADTIRCIEALRRQDYPNFEVLLADNGSEAEEVEQLSTLYRDDPLVQLTLNEENLGFTLGNNRLLERLLKRTDLEYVALLNNDTEVDPCWLSSLTCCARETGSAMVASKMIFMEEPNCLDNVGHFMLNTGEIMPLGNSMRESRFNKRLPIFGACAGAALYSLSMLREVGLFDPFFHTGYEDAELGARACLLGYTCTFEPQARVLHCGSASVKKIHNFDYVVRLVINIWYTHLKLFPLPVLLLNAPFVLLKYLIVAIGSLITGRPRILWVHLVALRQLFGHRLPEVFSARQQFLRNHTPSMAVALRNQRFFVPTYALYFYRFIMQGRKTIFE